MRNIEIMKKRGTPAASGPPSRRHRPSDKFKFVNNARGLPPRNPSVDMRWKLDAQKALMLLDEKERYEMAEWMTSGMTVTPPNIERMIKKLAGILSPKQ